MLGKTLLSVVAIAVCFLLVRDWIYPGARRKRIGPIDWKIVERPRVIKLLPRLLWTLVRNPKLLVLGIMGIFLGIAAVKLRGKLPIMEWVTIAYFAGFTILLSLVMLVMAALYDGARRGEQDTEDTLSKKADFMDETGILGGDSWNGGGDLGGGG